MIVRAEKISTILPVMCMNERIVEIVVRRNPVVLGLLFFQQTVGKGQPDGHQHYHDGGVEIGISIAVLIHGESFWRGWTITWHA